MLHAVWNALVKSDSDRLIAQAVVIGVASAIGAACVPFAPIPERSAWPFLVVSVFVHTGYYLFLVRGYEHGDLSQVYPVARGIAPSIVALLAIPLAGEGLTAVQFAGVLLASAGIVSLAFARRGSGSRVAVGYAGVTGLFIVGYTLIDGLGVRHAGAPAGYVAWLMLMSGLPLVGYVVVRQRQRLSRYDAAQWRRGALGGAIAFIGYGIVVWVMAGSRLAHVAALRETSVIIAALIGTVVLGEAGLGRRLVAAACVAAGNALLHLG